LKFNFNVEVRQKFFAARPLAGSALPAAGERSAPPPAGGALPADPAGGKGHTARAQGLG